MRRGIGLLGALAALVPLAAGAQSNYLGVLKPPRGGDLLLGGYAAGSADPGQRLTLGWRYSRYFSVEGELVDPGRPVPDPFASPASLASGWRTPGLGVDTIATLPVWRFSFYGRLGAYRGEDLRTPFGAASPSLVGDPARTRWRAGLGLRYDFTDALGIQAEMQRQVPFAAPFASEGEADQFSVGLRWRF